METDAWFDKFKKPLKFLITLQKHWPNFDLIATSVQFERNTQRF